MTKEISQVLKIILLGMIINSCSSKKSNGNIEDDSIKIIAVDSLKFLNYYTCEFERRGNQSGYLLIKKSKTSLTSKDILISKNINFNNLCDVIEFQPNNSETTFRGHATINGIYEDEKLVIDLRNNIEKRYYELCHGIQIEKKK